MENLCLRDEESPRGEVGDGLLNVEGTLEGDFILRRRKVISNEKIPDYGKKSPSVGSPEQQSDQEAEERRKTPSPDLDKQRISRRDGPRARMWRKMSGVFIKLKRQSESSVERPQPKKEIDTTVLKRYWVTADVHKGDDATFIIFALRDFVVHILFLTLLLCMMYGPMDYAQNYYATIMSDLLTKSKFESQLGDKQFTETFRTMRAVPQVWDYFIGVIRPFIFDSPAGLSQKTEDAQSILSESLFIGAPAVRMIRVMNNTCKTATLFKDLFKTCYDLFTPEHEDTSDFGAASAGSAHASPWKYRKHDLDGYAPFHGIFGTYPDTGYQFNFTSDVHFTLNWLKELYAKHWVGPGTRFINFDFTLYTQNTNLFCVVRLAFEVLPTGGLIPHWNFYTLKLHRYVNPKEYFVAACEIIFLIFTIYFIFEEGQQIIILGRAYFTNFWNYVDILVITFSVMTIFMLIWRLYTVTVTLDTKLQTIRTSNHASFEYLVWIQNHFINILSTTFFLAWFKLLKFYSIDRSVQLVLHVFAEVCNELLISLLFCLGIITGFALMGLVIFGDTVEEFSTFKNSFFTITALYMGRMEFLGACYRSNPFTSAIFISSYILVVLIMYFQVFVALLVHGFSKIIVFMHEQQNRLYLSDLVWNTLIHFLSGLGQQYLVMKLEAKALKEQNERDYDDFVQVLQRHGLPRRECHILMRVYHMHRGEEILRDKLSEIYDELWIRNQLFVEVAGHNKAIELISKMERMIDHCDQAIIDVEVKLGILSRNYSSI